MKNEKHPVAVQLNGMHMCKQIREVVFWFLCTCALYTHICTSACYKLLVIRVFLSFFVVFPKPLVFKYYSNIKPYISGLYAKT